MSPVAPAEATPQPAKWDGTRVLFDIVEGGVVVPCAISREALREVTGRNYGKPQELLASFEKARPTIEAVAHAKHRAQQSSTGLLIVWSGDLDEYAAPGEAAPE